MGARQSDLALGRDWHMHPVSSLWRGQAFFSSTSTLCSENTVLKDPSRDAWFFLCLAERNVCQIFTSKLQHLQLKGNKAAANLNGWGSVGVGSTALYWEYCLGSTALHHCLGSTALRQRVLLWLYCVLHWSVLSWFYCIALKCTVYCTKVYCLGSMELHWSVLCTALKCTVLVLWNYIEVYCVLHWSVLYLRCLRCPLWWPPPPAAGSMCLKQETATVTPGNLLSSPLMLCFQGNAQVVSFSCKPWGQQANFST